MKTLITFHFYYPVNNEHVSTEYIFNCSESQARREAEQMGKVLSDCFTGITSKCI